MLVSGRVPFFCLNGNWRISLVLGVYKVDVCKFFTNRNGKSTCESWYKESKMQQDCVSCLWFQPIGKNISRNGNIPKILGMKITNI